MILSDASSQRWQGYLDNGTAKCSRSISENPPHVYMLELKAICLALKVYILKVAVQTGYISQPAKENMPLQCNIAEIGSLAQEALLNEHLVFLQIVCNYWRKQWDLAQEYIAPLKERNLSFVHAKGIGPVEIPNGSGTIQSCKLRPSIIVLCVYVLVICVYTFFTRLIFLHSCNETWILIKRFL